MEFEQLTELDDILFTDEAEDIVNKSDWATAKQHCDHIRDVRQEMETLQSGLKTLRERLFPPAGRLPGEGDGEAHVPAAPRFRRENRSDADPFTIEEIRPLFPPYVRIHAHKRDPGWQLFIKRGNVPDCPTIGRFRSWRKHGHTGAVEQLLKFAWSDAVANAGLACPIDGLL